MRTVLTVVMAGFSLLYASAKANATPIELITNGDFETGTFLGWTITNQAGGSGTFFIDTPGTPTPVSGFPTVGSPANGSFYAVTDQTGPGAHALSQSFTVAPGSTVTLSFDMFVNDQSGSGGIVHPSGLDYTSGGTLAPNQHARVDILTAGASAFDTGAGVLANFYLGVDAGGNPHPFTPYVFDVTGIVGGGGTFQIRFAEVDNQFFFHQGVDNVSILQTSQVPEAGTLLLLGTGLGAAAVRRRRNAAS
jgi:hypothetical protein